MQQLASFLMEGMQKVCQQQQQMVEMCMQRQQPTIGLRSFDQMAIGGRLESAPAAGLATSGSSAALALQDATRPRTEQTQPSAAGTTPLLDQGAALPQNGAPPAQGGELPQGDAAPAQVGVPGQEAGAGALALLEALDVRELEKKRVKDAGKHGKEQGQRAKGKGKAAGKPKCKAKTEQGTGGGQKATHKSAASHPIFKVERTRSQVMCRTGKPGPGQCHSIRFGKGLECATEAAAKAKAEEWVRNTRRRSR